MGGRYLITGTQLSLIKQQVTEADLQKLLKEIGDKQFLLASDRSLSEDLAFVRKNMRWRALPSFLRGDGGK